MKIETTRDVLKDLRSYLDGAGWLLKWYKSTDNHLTYFLAGNRGNHYTDGERRMDIELRISGDKVIIDTESQYINSVYNDVAKICTMTIPVCPKGVPRIYAKEESLSFRPDIELLEPERVGQVKLQGRRQSLADAHRQIRERYSQLDLPENPKKIWIVCQ